MKRRSAAVTGLGIITAIGSNIPSSWEILIKGTCGIEPVNLFDVSHYRSQKAAEVNGFDPLLFFSARNLQRMSRCDQMGLKGASEAVPGFPDWSGKVRIKSAWGFTSAAVRGGSFRPNGTVKKCSRKGGAGPGDA